MLQFSIGVSALQAAQQGLAVAGNNLANASTPGYHRQNIKLSTQGTQQIGSTSLGGGVTVTDIARAVSEQLDSSLTQQLTQNGFIEARLGSNTQIEQRISTGDASPAGQLENLLNNLEKLSANPSNIAARQVTLASATSVTREFNSLSNDLFKFQQGVDKSINVVVDQLNPKLKEIANLNAQISRSSIQGGTPNDLLDQRDQLVNDVSQLIGVQVQAGEHGQVTLIASGVALVIAGTSQSLEVRSDKSGTVSLGVPGSAPSISATSGQLGGLLEQRNTTLPDYRSRIDTLARQIIKSFDAIQTTGLGGSGGFTQLNGQRGVRDSSALLNAAGLSFPPQSGSLFIGVTNTATGVRTLTEVVIDPQSQSLQNVATSIGNTVPNVQALINGQNGTLSLLAAPGFTFDFTGGVNSNLTTSFPGGSTTIPSASGAYTGSKNDHYTFKFTSAGTVGVTPNLQAQVTDTAGNLLGTVNVGKGYQAGQPLKTANGVSIELSAGDVVAGDSFSTQVVGNPDSAGILASLGLNTFFSGNDAASIGVNSDLVNDPNRLATSRTGESNDSTNLQRFLGLRDTSVLNNGTQTFSEFFNGIVADVGTDVRSLTQQQSTNQLLTNRIQAQQQSVSGVDTNQELSQVLKYQQMFQLAGKYISAVNDSLQELLHITP